MSRDVRQATAEPGRARAVGSLGDSEAYCRDPTALATSGRFARLYLRRALYDQIVPILAKIDKPTVALVGKAGTGKSRIVQALAHQFLTGEDVPRDLRRMRVLELDFGAFMAAAGPREVEARATELCRNAAAAGRDVLLFIDEAHVLLESKVGTLSLGEILKPSLARGEFCCIVATTDEGYHRTFETDEAMARRFQRVEVPEPDEAETMAILSRSVAGLATAHGMLITPDDVSQAVVLSRRYVRHRANPDKANDLLDEAMALQRVDYEREPGRRGEFARWAAASANDARRGGRTDDADRLDAIARAAASGPPVPFDARYLGRVINRWTGLPTEVMGGGATALDGLRERLLGRIVGQDEAVSRLAQAVVRGVSGAGRQTGPLASAFLAGPTGVGKTETARVLAANILGSEKALYRIDGSELAEPHSVARLIGAPPGYVGYDEGGDLTAFVREHHFGVIIVDEFEKANRSIHDLFLQVLEEGELQDGRGVRVDFSGQVILFTSNLEVPDAQQAIGFVAGPDSFPTQEATDDATLRQRLCRHLRPELVNRFDLVLRYRSLGRDDVRRIGRQMADAFCARMQKERAIEVVIPDSIINEVADAAYSQTSGARAVRRAFDREIGDVVANWLVTNGGRRGGRIVLAQSVVPPA